MAMLFYALLLCLASWSVDARSDYVGSIQPHTYTSWGSWGHEDWCTEGSYAYGFTLNVEGQQGKGDDTALNGIKLHCRTYCGAHSNSITSSVMIFGNWQQTKNCPAGNFLKGAWVRSERQGSVDNTAVNNYDFLCEHFHYTSHIYHLQGNGMPWGSWTARQECPTGSYICGLKTQVEPSQGRGDDTALNDARFYCCRLTKTSCSGRR
ncbi:vitelline membrane outer layer protein 1 homolog isoform X2 [Actinia tenebrosa]|uniref:Vitelline membrane outer layer protein 1 homolog isoform X2 n=1 Tax=Actinia tenebrosa TaxID=6105 RepID=A0A6P8HJH4_ACTTE|nr:vitelline membrane outer layer protein 1 homolog isoform X2 [Actinia tenebrosa]